ncbi:MAG: fluoride efflux transporter CrcB [Chloroflexota bacterium]
MDKFILISIGAVLGANARYWVGGWAAEHLGSEFPYGTLIINLIGSFLLGFFITTFTNRYMVNPYWRLFIAIGFLGSYTTFSTYTYESVNLLIQGQLWLGIVNLFGGSFLGAIAVILGILLGRII